jgi:hypothetical protein
MILFLELFTFIILLNFEVLRKITFMIFVFYFLLVLEIITFIFPLNFVSS